MLVIEINQLMPTISETLVLEFELGFGFFGGLFMHFGIDPDNGAIMVFLKSILPVNDFLLILLLILIGIGATAVGILGIFVDTGKFGLFVVWSAWVSGLIIPIGGATAVVGIFLLIGAILLGPVAYDIQNS